MYISSTIFNFTKFFGIDEADNQSHNTMKLPNNKVELATKKICSI